MPKPMVFTNAVLEISEAFIMPEVIESVAGKFARRQYIAWRSSVDGRQITAIAKNLNKAHGRSIMDRRTKGYKYYSVEYNQWAKEYARALPERPDEKPIDLFRVTPSRDKGTQSNKTIGESPL